MNLVHCQAIKSIGPFPSKENLDLCSLFTVKMLVLFKFLSNNYPCYVSKLYNFFCKLCKEVLIQFWFKSTINTMVLYINQYIYIYVYILSYHIRLRGNWYKIYFTWYTVYYHVDIAYIFDIANTINSILLIHITHVIGQHA